MTNRLRSLTVENFRSIRGPVHVSLDAPVVLIHGPNGAGKTSLLSAIELGLTRQVASLGRMDPGYIEHLPHKETGPEQCRIALSLGDVASSVDAVLTVNGREILGQAALNPDDAHFFTERCYLAQSTLSRLLEIYQHQDARRSDSPLTRFVKELLGLERFDTLIDGLQSAGHVTRLREPVPAYWSAREDIRDLEKKLGVAADSVSAVRASLVIQESLFREIAGSVAPPASQALDIGMLNTLLTSSVQDDERALQDWARRRRDLVGAVEQVGAFNQAAARDDRQAAETDLVNARKLLEDWREGEGSALAGVISELQRDYTDLPGVEPDAAAAHKTASTFVTSERLRVQRTLDTDASEGQRLADQRAAVRQGEARIANIDSELADTAGVNEELARSLSSLAPHIHGETCPVCERDFREVSPTLPLAARLAERIASLVTAAGRLQSLSRDKAITASAVNAAKRTVADLESRQLPVERRDALKSQSARLDELELRLAQLAKIAEEGTQLHLAVAQAAQHLASLGSRDASVEGLLGFVAQLADAFGVPRPEEDEPLAQTLTRLQNVATNHEVEIAARQANWRRAIEVLAEIQTLQQLVRAQEVDEADIRTRLNRLATAKTEADRRIDVAKDLVRRARNIRTEIVRKVFNDDLNALWRNLFIRLAPDEAFVPRFALPSSSTGPVEAVLETVHRSGGTGGNPRAMLSAGNLNTAALTLFLSLHLAVRPQLPWLIIDDPVQSMDEIHIAQFAALLRSLKQTGRQIIIAVHERSLFEYLTLELSPTFLDDRLITIELGRGADGATVAPWNPRTFLPDRAVAA